jgi:hypothetical protein
MPALIKVIISRAGSGKSSTGPAGKNYLLYLINTNISKIYLAWEKYFFTHTTISIQN